MRPKLKLNQIKSLHDARYCSAVGVELLGFQMDEARDEFVKPAAIAEIMEWLSGPEAVGEFAYEAPSEIVEAAEKAKLTWVSVPLDYPAPTATELPANLIFRALEINLEMLDKISALAAEFPQARFEFSVNPEDTEVWTALLDSGLVERSLLGYAEPDPIYDLLKKNGLKPFAFSLGLFVEEPDGLLDYETCDDFIDQYQALLPA